MLGFVANTEIQKYRNTEMVRTKIYTEVPGPNRRRKKKKSGVTRNVGRQRKEDTR